MTVKAIDAVIAGQWAIQPEWLDIITSIAERESEYHGKPEALEAKLGRPLGNTMRTTVRDGVATIPFEGPMFRRANLMTQYSGATSYDTLATDFTAALEDPSVTAIVGYFDTPGGEVTGASELAAMVAAARGKKPLIAYVGGQLASAGLWIGSAFDRIVAADTASIGCIGAQIGASVRDPRPGEKSYRFVSSQTPLKNADLGTEVGAAEAQRLADSFGQVFIENLAKYRSTTVETVNEQYGQGAVFIASDALARGMIDEISTYENLISQLSTTGASMDWKDLTAATLAENRPDLATAIGEQAVAKAGIDIEAAKTAAAAGERQRITDIMAAADGFDGTAELVTAAVADSSKTAATFALDLLKHVKATGTGAKPSAQDKNGAAHLAALAAAEGAQPPAKPTEPDNTTTTGAAATQADADLAVLKAAGLL